MVDFLGVQISFATLSLWISLWGIVVGLFIFNLTRKGKENNNITLRLQMDEAKKYKMSQTMSKTRYGKFYQKNLASFFGEDTFLGKISSKLIENPHDLDRKLKLIESDMSVEEFSSIKVMTLISGLIMAISGLLLNLGTVFSIGGVLLIIISFYLEEKLVNEKIKERTISIERGLPNFLDLLYSACKTGHTITEALMKVSTKYTGVISDEFNKTMIEFKSNGGNFPLAINNMADRNNIESLTNVLFDILISYSKGDDKIIETIQQEAETMREIVNAEIDEQANKKSTELMVPMILFLFAPLLAFILLPFLSQFTAIMGS